MLLQPTITQAHEGGELGIEIQVERVPPGETLPIVGSDWAASAPLEVWLQPAGQPRIRLGTILTGPDGHFLASVQIPSSAPSGPAAVEVVSTYGVRDTALVTIDPAAPPASARPGTIAGDSPADEIDPFPFIALAGAITAVLLMGYKTRRAKAVA